MEAGHSPNGPKRPHIGRHFSNYNNQTFRADFWDDEKEGHATFIARFAEQRVYMIGGQGDQMVCFYGPLQGRFELPSFQGYTYMGKASVRAIPADNWVFYDKEKQIAVQYFDRNDVHDPLAFNWANQTHSADFQWFEFDQGSQEDNIFLPSFVAPELTCNPAPPQFAEFEREATLDPFLIVSAHKHSMKFLQAIKNMRKH
eukprot:TRINITY_DN247_c0_g1_i1.p1 TRINITY_DN247_c0_g1~~TRINITY_DN247_c0_g1_i1.p1  ORF type:complete len:200 (+),score=61.33 TRINITY_DN247_c0_g1_i1:652-1251(+)